MFLKTKSPGNGISRKKEELDLADQKTLNERLNKGAKELAANSGGGEVRIHGLDGKIRDSDTVKPGNDPNPPKDNKH
jgi:hypothetical protein